MQQRSTSDLTGLELFCSLHYMCARCWITLSHIIISRIRSLFENQVKKYKKSIPQKQGKTKTKWKARKTKNQGGAAAIYIYYGILTLYKSYICTLHYLGGEKCQIFGKIRRSIGDRCFVCNAIQWIACFFSGVAKKL